MKVLTNEHQKSYQNSKICYICKEKFKDKHAKDKKFLKVRDHCHTGEHRGAAHNICNVSYSVPKEMPIVFHNGSNYDYHFIIKELGEEFEKQFTCLGENAEKYITFSVLIEKEVTRIDKNGEEITKTISCRLQFIDSARFMASSLSNLVNNLAGSFIELNVNTIEIIKKCETYGIKYKNCECFLECANFKDNLIRYKCLCFNKNYQKKFDGNLNKQFFNTYKFSIHDINEFILLFRKGVNLYEYI